jgi:hypothetical protein
MSRNMGKAWTGPAIVEWSLTEMGQRTGRVSRELDSGGAIRLVNRSQRRVIGYCVSPEDLPGHLREAEEHLLEPPRPQRTRGGRVYYEAMREEVTHGELAAVTAREAARVLDVPERTVLGWRARACTLNGASHG